MTSLPKITMPFEYDKPEPSLCDSCIHAHNMSDGGTVGVGMLGQGYKVYLQRYCPKPPEGETSGGRAIHTCGYSSCSYYQKKKSKRKKNANNRVVRNMRRK